MLSPVLEPSLLLAELVGVLLGDGHLTKLPQHSIIVSASTVGGTRYLAHLQSLLRTGLGQEPLVYPQKNSRCVQLRINSKPLMAELVGLGLRRGNKVKNQVGVPPWVVGHPPFSIACLRGLFDTDGSIYMQKHQRYGLCFTNKSLPLLNFFQSTCAGLGVRTSQTDDDLFVNEVSSVRTFISRVRPFKALSLGLDVLLSNLAQPSSDRLVPCPVCGQLFITHPSWARPQKFCSVACVTNHKRLLSRKPSHARFLLLLEEHDNKFSAVGRALGVSHTTVRRWLLDLPADYTKHSP